MYEELMRGYDKDETVAIVSHVFESDNDEMVVIPSIDAVSLCPHHLLPILYTAHVGYIPNGHVIGLSKIPRLVKHLAAKPVIQEDLVGEIALELYKALAPTGVMVVLDGQHACMRARGIREKDSVTRTSKTVGVFQTDAAAKAEFLALINSKR
jgi:GTP cyclohydrolase I